MLPILSPITGTTQVAATQLVVAPPTYLLLKDNLADQAMKVRMAKVVAIQVPVKECGPAVVAVGVIAAHARVSWTFEHTMENWPSSLSQSWFLQLPQWLCRLLLHSRAIKQIKYKRIRTKAQTLTMGQVLPPHWLQPAALHRQLNPQQRHLYPVVLRHGAQPKHHILLQLLLCRRRRQTRQRCNQQQAIYQHRHHPQHQQYHHLLQWQRRLNQVILQVFPRLFRHILRL
mmetsp:Transcript_16560/g.34157  ORF Transcript_16560/g.34157 Transcript_16560/m.34157 type:complete len:229 (-) Transcript_16560:1496-2182(-)